MATEFHQMANEKSPQSLARRERQILELIYQLDEVSVSDVLDRLPNPPSYSTVRTIIRLLERKGFLKHRRDGMKYIYRPVESREVVRRSAVAHLFKTFFQGSPSDAVAAILDVSGDDLTDSELARLKKLVQNAKRKEL
jgi:predicted transcriptional regulator